MSTILMYDVWKVVGVIIIKNIKIQIPCKGKKCAKVGGKFICND